jgi:ADP-ribose pyrophosphatase
MTSLNPLISGININCCVGKQYPGGPLRPFSPVFYEDKQLSNWNDTGKGAPWAAPRVSDDILETLPKNPTLSQGQTTGILGRGYLGKYGPNTAADPSISRFNPVTGKIEFALVQRNETPPTWAIPGGMVDPGEISSLAAKREFGEEAGCSLDNTSIIPVELYSGYVDDWRNTDHAWMCTTVFHWHDSDCSSLGKMKLKSDGVETKKAEWISFDDIKSGKYPMFADHAKYIEMAVDRIRSM